jgi:hypothetical protein
MAIAGQLWDPDKSVLASIIEKHNGVLIRAAHELKVRRHTLLKKIRQYPDLVELLEDHREDYEDDILDLAENSLIVALKNQANDPSNAVRVGMFVLNSKGKKRKWNNNREDGTEKSEANEAFMAVMNQMTKTQMDIQSRDLKNDETTIINDNKS